MTACEAADALGVNERTVRRAIADGRITATKQRGVYDVDLAQAREAVGTRRSASLYRAALADALYKLRGLGYEGDAQDIERRHGLVFVEPKPEVFAA